MTEVEEGDWLTERPEAGEEDERIETLAGVQPAKRRRQADYQRLMNVCEACQ